jgi:hypothetical protein
MNKITKFLTITLLPAATVLVATSPASAVNSDTARAAVVVQPSPNTVGTGELKNGGTFGWDMADNTIPWLKLGSQLRGEIRAAQTKSDAAAEKATAAENKADDALARPDKGGAQTLFTKAGTTIVNIGGTFSTRHTEVGTFTMKKGTWLTSLQAKFNRKTASPAGDPDVQPQLQLVCDGQYVTIMGNSISPALDADLTGSAVNIITVTADTTCTVNTFGYNSVRGQQGSGEITVDAQVIATNA